MHARIATPETHPKHLVVGHLFAGPCVESKKTEVYFCDRYDPRKGYWLTCLSGPMERKNVSERAIGRTFREAKDRGATWFVPEWSLKIEKPKQAILPYFQAADPEHYRFNGRAFILLGRNKAQEAASRSGQRFFDVQIRGRGVNKITAPECEVFGRLPSPWDPKKPF